MAFHVSLVGRKDFSGEIYRQVRILNRRLRPGDRMPPSRELASGACRGARYSDDGL
jgi:GntR family transcriptional regulator / MocR family aminotransferase